MLKIWLRCDLRSPPFGTSNRDLARVALEQAEWADQRGFEAVQDLEELKKLGIYRVVTPDECLALGRSLASSNSVLIFNAMLAGLPEDLSWSSLELFATKVLPRLL